MGDINPRAGEFQEYRRAVRDLCGRFDSQYWQEVEGRAEYPEAFVKALTEAGWLAALIPERYGGGGLSVTEASVILEEINRSGANSGACHAQMTSWARCSGTADEQKQHYLPAIASGRLRLQSFAVTEPTTGTDTTKTRTVAVRSGDRYIVNGQKVWISRIQHSDLMLLLARTTPLSDIKKKTDGLSIFLVDLRDAERQGMTVRPIRTW
jgi:acyl-CoA dehydrogenase